MKYDFTSIMERHGKDAIAVDGLGTGFYVLNNPTGVNQESTAIGAPGLFIQGSEGTRDFAGRISHHGE